MKGKALKNILLQEHKILFVKATTYYDGLSSAFIWPVLEAIPLKGSSFSKSLKALKETSYNLIVTSSNALIAQEKELNALKEDPYLRVIGAPGPQTLERLKKNLFQSFRTFKAPSSEPYGLEALLKDPLFQNNVTLILTAQGGVSKTITKKFPNFPLQVFEVYALKEGSFSFAEFLAFHKIDISTFTEIVVECRSGLTLEASFDKLLSHFGSIEALNQKIRFKVWGSSTKNKAQELKIKSFYKFDPLTSCRMEKNFAFFFT
jgi:uroporphyrinogen-III synthase